MSMLPASEPPSCALTEMLLLRVTKETPGRETLPPLLLGPVILNDFPDKV